MCSIKDNSNQTWNTEVALIIMEASFPDNRMLLQFASNTK